MDRLAHSNVKSYARAKRVRAKIHGSKDRPRLSVKISNHHIIAQLIDDDAQRTLVYVSSVGSNSQTGSLSELADKIGSELSLKAKKAKITFVVFDRGSRLYHGRIKLLAEAARRQGLEF